MTTPNATAYFNAVMAFWGREATHKDHLNVFSYKVLHTLCLKANTKSFAIIPYYTRFTEMKLASKGLFKAMVVLFEKFVNMVEFFSPLRAGGYIVEINL